MESSEEKSSVSLPKKITNNRFIIVFIVLIVVGGGYGLLKYFKSKKHIQTDDAQIAALISPVIPHVSGYISKVYVVDNQIVQIGDTLLVLDDRDFQVELASAKAEVEASKSNLAIARAGFSVNRANVSTSKANINTVDAQIQEANVHVWQSGVDFVRYANSLKDGGVTQQQYDAALAAKESAEKQLAILKAQKIEATKQTEGISTQNEINTGQVAAAKAMLAKSESAVQAAQLSLSYTLILAEVNGQVSKVNLQKGQYLQAGQALFSVVPQGDKWVVANFKETQLKKMKLGQKVLITVDAYPSARLEGFVSSFSPATGAAESLLPPDNASGNFVKVVQRLPVKIEFIRSDDKRVENLSVGLNVTVDVLIDSLIKR